MNAFAQRRPFAGIFAALARAIAAAQRRHPPDSAWEDAANLDARARADAGIGPGEVEPRPRRGADPGPAPFAAAVVHGKIGF